MFIYFDGLIKARLCYTLFDKKIKYILKFTSKKTEVETEKFVFRYNQRLKRTRQVIYNSV